MEPDKTPIVHGEDGTGKPRGGAFIFFDWRRGEMTDRVTLGPPGGGASRGLRAVERIAGHRFGLFWENGSVSAVMVVFAPRFDEAGRRRIAGVTDNSVLEETVERSLNGALLWDEVKDQPGHSALGLSGGRCSGCASRAQLP